MKGPNNPLLDGVSQETGLKTQAQNEVERLLAPYKSSKAVNRFISGYSSPKTKRYYLRCLIQYLKYVREVKGLNLSPDELLLDNRRCIFESPAVDTETKRKHTDAVLDFLEQLRHNGLAGTSREVYAAVVKSFYAKNDSALWGNFAVARDAPKEPIPALRSEDIRLVMRSLPVQIRTPLLITWQSSVEIDRVLGLRWQDVSGIERGENPLRLQFFGRKRHRRPYSTFIGTDGINHLRIWREEWKSLNSRDPHLQDLVFLGKAGRPVDFSWLNERMRRMALRLSAQGLIKNGNPRSWHSHSLRHNFRSEAAHAGIKSEIAEFLMGHIGGIVYVYNHRDELHPDDLVKEYLKVEPFVSLDYTETALRQEYESREETLLRKVLKLEKDYESLKREVLSGRQAPHQSSPSAP